MLQFHVASCFFPFCVKKKGCVLLVSTTREFFSGLDFIVISYHPGPAQMASVLREGHLDVSRATYKAHSREV